MKAPFFKSAPETPGAESPTDNHFAANLPEPTIRGTCEPYEGPERCMRCHRRASCLFDFGDTLPELFPNGKVRLCTPCGNELANLSMIFIPAGHES